MPKALPDYSGPKLARFSNYKNEPEFLSIAGRSQASLVLEVQIDQQRYACKIFNNFNPIKEQVGVVNFEELAKNRESGLKKRLYLTAAPFFRECRAYGLLQECGYDGAFAAKCYGYLELSLAKANQLRAQFPPVLEFWPSIYEDQQEMKAYRPPKFAMIIKEWRDDIKDFAHQTPKEDLTTLQQLNGLGLYLRNVEADNLSGGKVRSFADSWTEPFWLMEGKDEEAKAEARREDIEKYEVRVKREQEESSEAQ